MSQQPVQRKKGGGGNGDAPAASRSDKHVHVHEGTNGEEKTHFKPYQTGKWTYSAYLVLLIISYYTLPSDLHPSQPSLLHVWYYGWITALSTGLGALPLIVSDLGKKVILRRCEAPEATLTSCNFSSFFSAHQMLGASNAIACGMMLSASYSLVMEGAALPPDGWVLSEVARVIIGVVVGLLFIYLTKLWLDQHEVSRSSSSSYSNGNSIFALVARASSCSPSPGHLRVLPSPLQDIHLGALEGADAKKAVLIVFVMFLHSFSEGVGIGVSFGGISGAQLGFLISVTLAVHNVPEGLAVALVLHPRGVSKMNTGLWCIFTSLPQPLMAVPAYIFIDKFLPFLPVGLGFAAGAMFWVACAELFLEAVEDTGTLLAAVTTTASFFTMIYVHTFLEREDF
jgi:ZIP family zinc transporter